MINKTYKTITQSPCFLLMVKFTKDLSLTKYLGCFMENKLITPTQSGFERGDSCINQLLSVTHEFFKFFYYGLDVRSVFSDISKAFDEVCHSGFIFKLEQNGISRDLLNILIDFLNITKQRMMLNGQISA